MSMMLLFFMKESITIYNSVDPSLKYSIPGLMKLPYTAASCHTTDVKPHVPGLGRHDIEQEMGPVTTSHYGDISSGPIGEEDLDTITTSSYTPMGHQLRRESASSRTPMMTSMRRSDTISQLQGSNCVTIRIVMPSNFGWRSWRWYEAAIETTAVGIYLYATFVLTSLLFLNADKAIVYATVMAISLSGVRVLTALF